MDWMARARSYRPKYRYWRTVAFAGLFGFAFTLLAMEVLSTRAMSLTSLTVVLAAMAGSLFGVCVVGAISGSRTRRRLGKQNSCSTPRSAT